jgi:histidinol-phosphate aminotransferase
MIAPAEVCDLMNRIRKPFNINSLAQVAVTAAVKDREHLRRVQDLTWSGLDYYYSQLTAMGLNYLPSQGNFVLFDTGRNGEDMFHEMLREGVILRPVTSYGFPRHLRMSVGLPEENQAAIATLKSVLSR